MPICVYSRCHGKGTYTSLTIKKLKFFVNLLAAIFGDQRINCFREKR